MGSYPQPDWLIDRELLTSQMPPRTRLAPDCGMKYLPREVAFRKLKAMVDGAKIVRAEL